MEIIITSIVLALYVVSLFVILFNNIDLTSGLTKIGVGNRNYNQRALFFTILVTMMGPGFSLGLGEKTYEFGYIYLIFYLFSLFQLYLFSIFFANKVKPLIENMTDPKNTISMGDIVEECLGGKISKIVLGHITLMFNIVIVGVVSLGGGKILNHLYNIDLGLASFLIVIFVAIYSALGGINVVIKTDKMQAILIMLAGLICLYLGIENISSDNFDSKWLWNNENTINASEMFSIIIAMFLGEAFVSVYFIRTMLSENGEIAKKAFRNVSIFGIFLFIAFSTASISSHNIDYDTSKISYFALAMHSDFGNIFLPILALGLVSVVMSTLDSVLNNSAIVAIKDITYPILNIKKLEANIERKLYVIFVGIVSFLGVIIALIFNDIFQMLVIAYHIWAPTIVYPFAILLLTPKTKRYKWTFLYSIFGGLVGYFLISKIIPLPAILLGIIFNAFAFHLSELFFNKKS